MLKAIVLALLASAIMACGVVFEGAAQTQAALDVVHVAQRTSSIQLQERMLAGAAARLQKSWAQPTRWNASAAEALSAIYAMRANAAGGDEAIYAESMLWAMRATQIGPTQPNAWARLATFSIMDLAHAPCAAQTCLERSWIAAPMLDAESDCARLRIAHAGGLQESLISERIDWYLRSGVGADQAAACLAFVPREDLFQMMLRSRSSATP
ncbi:hypothetical protein [Terricaulis silvestris]|uniref:Uncharacterized protein n=1 Tax=Terricaulis silvestris TaxID=2686094 RepID=A0A6I6MJV9_9CAUL|nr:hypothetical protein [Terricaulis silvestris]QGZ93366.1 hypothetical protein DSM104635_00176 [Terricaulis silvestris]